MADVIKKTTNKFTKGLVMDFSPENTQNEVLTHALNATLLTFNGNELSLQNDMGNARVETAYLPEGYMPVGTCEYGGIIYIVSYNPLEDKSQIGCFPSPERNISSEELGLSTATLDRSKFQGYSQDGVSPTGDIKNLTQHVLLKSDNLNPGDKFLICAENALYNERLADLWVDYDDKRYTQNPLENPNGFELITNPIIALHVVSIEDSGRIVYLNSDVRQYEKTNTSSKEDPATGNVTQYTDVYKYHILGGMMEGANQMAKEDIDNYRNTLSSGYSVFKSKTSGKLAILAELLTIDSYSVTHSLQPRKAFDENGEEYNVESSFDIVIHTEITPTITPENFNLVPKLLYYHLKNSQGYLHAIDGDETVVRPLFLEGIDPLTNQPTSRLNSDFLRTNLSDIYTKDYNEELQKTGQFNFPKKDTYHGRMQPIKDDLVNATTNSKTYTKFTEGKYHRTTAVQLMGDLTSMSTAEAKLAYENFSKYYIDELLARFYYYDYHKTGYQKVDKNTQLEESYTYYVQVPAFKYTDAERNMEKYKDKGITLYKYSSEPSIATDDTINNTTVEKFQEQEVHTYFEVNLADYDTTEKLYYYDESARKYIELLGEPLTGVTYYALEIEVTFVSIGKEINKDNYKGDIYYYPTKKDIVEATESDLEKYWDFATYPLSSEAPWGCPITLYERTDESGYRVATDSEILNFNTTDVELFYRPDYVYVENMSLFNDNFGQLFIVLPMDTFMSVSRFQPDININYIQGCEKPTSKWENEPDFPETGFPKDDPLILYTVADFIPQNLTKDDKTIVKQYEDLKLANIKIPRVISNASADLPFKYDYTLVPCMNFGRLDHLAISNTVDFSKLHSFDQSDFTTWKYHIDDNHLRLTFGADVYDTYEDIKVDALVLEFYDCWGFAGSLEISDKKSYSGMFTKVIPLNTPGVLSKNRVWGNSYSDKYARNINITEHKSNTTTYDPSPSSLVFNKKTVTWIDAETGWRYNDGQNFSDEDNDCGTLYSNVIYGVRAYLRRPKAVGYDFIQKREMFLFTLPIYNDYYYTVNDFNVLENPKLEMMLTYKMQDKSTKIPYNKGEVIVNGYLKESNNKVQQYIQGKLDSSNGNTLDAIRYYKYGGVTDLYLEVGLLKDYQTLNLSYDPALNNHFSCTLELLSDSDEDSTYTISSEESLSLSSSDILNYTYDNYGKLIINVEDNKLSFADGTAKLRLEKGEYGDFAKSNFITKKDPTPLQLAYEFIVGYQINITNISSKEIPATTVCALFHQNENIYNHEDFGMREVVETSGETETVSLYSSTMYYNEGTMDQESFGICQQMKTTGTLSEQCSKVFPTSTEAQQIKTPGKLNTGEPLKQIVSSIGKLTFCMPHVHGLSDVNGVNLWYTKDGSEQNPIFGLPDEKGKWKVAGWGNGTGWDKDYDECYGIVPSDYLHKSPKYNLVLNTKNTMQYYSEFLSTIKLESETTGTTLGVDTGDPVYENCTTDMLPYTGITGTQLIDFNKKLLETMKSIYVYNPDYASLKVSIGDVNILDVKPKFTSNLICTESAFDFGNNTLNDFVYIGPMLITTYLNMLKKYSADSTNTEFIITKTTDQGEKKLLGTITFVPGYNYCGTKTNPYLVSSLTYNTSAPSELAGELEFKASSSLIVKHSNGDLSQLNGSVNKKALYAYSPDLNKLIQLDVSNYKINADGKLSLTSNTTAKEKKSYTCSTDSWTVENVEMESFTGMGYRFTQLFEGANDKLSEVELIARAYQQNNYMDTGILAIGPRSIIVATTYYNVNYSPESTYGTYINANVTPVGYKQGEYSYSVYNENLKIRCYAALLDKDKVVLHGATGVKCNLIDQDYATLHELATQSYNTVTLKLADGNFTSGSYASSYSSYYLNYLRKGNGTGFVMGNTITLTGGEWLYPEVPNDFRNDEVPDTGLDNNYGDRWDLPTNPSNPYDGDTILYEIFFDSLDYEVTRTTELANLDTDVINTKQTSQYANLSSKGYSVLYPEACFRGTSLTVNDLVYEPNLEGHRLFVKNGLCAPITTHRGKIYYRYRNNGNADASWRYTTEGRHKNCLYLYNGPSFIPDQLK